MSIYQFLRIFWARRWLIAATTGASLLGALVVVSLLPPRWEAHAKVMLNLLKPDPVTGAALGERSMGAYIATQMALVKDYSVVGEAVDQLGWISDPRLVESYGRTHDVRDFRHWLADQVIDATKVDVTQGSDILDIAYTGTSPDQAKGVVDALRKAYIGTSVGFRRQDATRSADWYQGEANKAKAAFDAAQAARDDFERSSGIIGITTANDTTDLESARLQALASVAPSVQPTIIAGGAAPTTASAQLAQLDANIAQASKTLGPNHPELQQMKAQRGALASEAAAERAAATRTVTGGGLDAAVKDQKTRVLAESQKLGRLKQLQAEVDLRRDMYNKAIAREAELRQQAASADLGITELDPATTDKDPTFPKKTLILSAALAGGFGVGVLLSLLLEFINRRVRSVEDLRINEGIPVLAVLTDAPRPDSPTGASSAPRRPSLPRRRPLAKAGT